MTRQAEVVVIGAGRVGLPLAAMFSLREVPTVVVDRDAGRCEEINAGSVPFYEPGLEAVLRSGDITATTSYDVVRTAKSVVVSVGTPLRSNVEPDLTALESAIRELAQVLVPGQLVVLRSTVPPGTTALVAGWIERLTELRVGQDVFLAFCPERLSEGAAMKELEDLPQIVGADDEASLDAAMSLFVRLAPKVLSTDSRSAELAKLLTNVSRYAEFAVANHLALLTEELGGNYHDIRAIAETGYPRGVGKKPGFAAGTCLRKDFGMLSELSFGPDILTAAWRVNESVPVRLIAGVRSRRPIRGARVAILGLAFKADVDDVRDSLSVKLYRQLLREAPLEVRVSDPYLGDVVELDGVGPVPNMTAASALADADIVFVATNHAEYHDLLRNPQGVAAHGLLVDLWNVSGADSVYSWIDSAGPPGVV